MYSLVRCLLSANFFCLDDYETFEICFRKGTFHVANFISKSWENSINDQHFVLKTWSLSLWYAPLQLYM